MEMRSNTNGVYQAEKKWIQLKASIRAWIYATAKKEYLIYIERYGNVPTDQELAELIGRVYRKVEDRNILIPFDEVKNNVGKFITIQNQKRMITDNSVPL